MRRDFALGRADVDRARECPRCAGRPFLSLPTVSVHWFSTSSSPVEEEKEFLKKPREREWPLAKDGLSQLSESEGGGEEGRERDSTNDLL